MTSRPRVTAKQTAKLLDVGPRSRHHAEIVLATGIPGLAHMVLAGAVHVFAASVIAQLPESWQRRIVQSGPHTVADVAAELQKGSRITTAAWDEAMVVAAIRGSYSAVDGKGGYLETFTALNKNYAAARKGMTIK